MPPTYAAPKTSTPDGAAGAPIDVAVIDHGAGAVDRQVVALGDPTDPAAVAAVKNAAPVAADYGQVARVLLYDSNGNPLVVAAGRLVVDGSGVTQPVSGAFFQGTQPVSVAAVIGVDVSDEDTRLLGRAKLLDSAGVVIDPAKAATQTDGTQKAITRGGAKGATAAADMTSTAQGADHQALDIQEYFGGAAIDPRSIRALTASDIVTANGDVDHDVANTLKNIQIAGHASPVDVPPTAVSANADRVRAHFDRYGAMVVRRRKIRESYTAVCRLAQANGRLDQTFTQVANTNKQWATLHHTVSATKEVRLQRCVVYITSDTVAGIQGIVELRRLDMATAPATGNPAITPTSARRGGTAAEAVCLYLPTTQGSEAAADADRPLGHVPFDTGISGAVSTVNPVPILIPVVLYDAATEDDEMMPPMLPVGTADGWAAMVRTVGVPVLRITIVWKFTEEIP